MNSKDVYLVPVPAERLQEVYAVLGERGQTRAHDLGGTPSESVLSDRVGVGALERLFHAALPLERRLMLSLANSAKRSLPSDDLVESLGGDREDGYVIPGIIGPLAKRARAAGLDSLPIKAFKDAQGRTSYTMSEGVARALRDVASDVPNDVDEFTSGGAVGDPAIMVAAKMDDLAEELGLRIEPTPASRKYRVGDSAGAWLQRRQGNLYFDMRPFRLADDMQIARELLDRMTTLAGRPIKPWMANVPLTALAHDWERAKVEIVIPYFEARLRHVARRT